MYNIYRYIWKVYYDYCYSKRTYDKYDDTSLNHSGDVIAALVPQPLSFIAHLMVPHKQHYIIPLLPGKVSCGTMRSEPPCYPSSSVDCCRT